MRGKKIACVDKVGLAGTKWFCSLRQITVLRRLRRLLSNSPNHLAPAKQAVCNLQICEIPRAYAQANGR